MSRRARFLTPLGWALLTGVALVAAVGAERVAGPEMPDAAGDLLAGLALLVGGAAAWAKRPGSRSGPLSVLAGVAWFAGDLTDVPPVCASRAARAPAAHLPERARRLARSRGGNRRGVRRWAGPGARALGVADDRAYGGGRDGRRVATSNSRRWSVAPARRRWPVPCDRRNACARCVRALGRRRSGCGRGGPTTPRWRSRPPACRLTCCGAVGPVPPSLDWWSISATASSRTR